MVCSELWHHNTDIKWNILQSSRICFQITARGNNNTLAALTFVSLLDATCRLWQNRFTSFLWCDSTTLKVQKSISQRLQFHTRFCHCAAVWKWSCGSISANYRSRHFHTVNGKLTKSSARRFSSSVASRSRIMACCRLSWATARSADRILEISSWTWDCVSAWTLDLVRAFSSSSLRSQYFFIINSHMNC